VGQLFPSSEKNFAIGEAKEMSKDFTKDCKGQNQPIVLRIDLGEITPDKITDLLYWGFHSGLITPRFLKRSLSKSKVYWKGEIKNKRQLQKEAVA
tara:strand:+ start:2924 stop:3208 length:285 start_codon:yes stop_codon:yes gene_type:complete